MRWGWLLYSLLVYSLLLVLLASCACEQPQPQYRHGVPPSVYVAPPSMYSTVLRRNKQGKMERVRVPVSAPVRRAGSSAPPPAAEAPPAYAPLPDEPSQPNAQIESDLNEIQNRFDEIRRKMQHEPNPEDVRVR
jgi:hypothetical protein